MPKKTKEEEPEELSAEDALKQIRAIIALVPDEEAEEEDEEEEEEEKPAKAAKKGKKGKGDDEDEEEEEEEESSEEVEFPSAKEVKKLDDEEIVELAGKIGITEITKPKALRPLLTTAALIGEDSTDDIEDEAYDALLEALGIKVPKKTEQKLEKLKEYFSATEEGDGDEKDEEEEEEEEDDDEKPKGKKGKKSKDEDEEEEEDEDDDLDPKVKKAIAKSVKAAESSDMMEALNAFNEAAPKKSKIKFDEDDEDSVSEAYAKLLALNVDDEGELTELGEPYIKDEEGYCHGLPLVDTDDENVGQCAVTEKKFSFDEDKETFSEVKAKKAAKKK